MTNPEQSTLGQRVTAQAAGVHGCEAAAIITTRTLNGRLIDRLTPFIADHPAEGLAWVDWAAVLDAGGWSGGEHRLIGIAASLAGGHRVDLSDVLQLDPGNAEIVLTALAHCLGIQEGCR